MYIHTHLHKNKHQHNKHSDYADYAHKKKAYMNKTRKHTNRNKLLHTYTHKIYMSNVDVKIKINTIYIYYNTDIPQNTQYIFRYR